MFETGQVVQGKCGCYVIEHEIGRGGRNRIFLVYAQEDHRQWVFRCPLDREWVRNAELSAMEDLDHPGLPEIREVFQYGDLIIIVESYIEGQNPEELQKSWIRKCGQPMPAWYAVDLVLAIAQTLSYLHQQEPPLIYQDLKPSNIIIQGNGQPVLVDLDTLIRQKVLPAEQEVLQAPEDALDIPGTRRLGTPGFAAPEQYGGSISPATDIYALGALLHYLLTGRNPVETPFYFPPVSQCSMQPDLRHRKKGKYSARKLDRVIAGCTVYEPGKRLTDDQVIRQLKICSYAARWRPACMAGSMVFLIGLICMIMVCQPDPSGQISAQDRFAQCIQRAGTVTGEKSDQLYREAVAIEPSSAEGYLGILENALADHIFSAGEEEELIEYLYSPEEDDSRDHLARLQENTSAYVQFSWKMGLAEYFYYEGTGNKVRADGWLQVVETAGMESLDLGPLDGQKDLIQEEAFLLSEIAEFYRSRIVSMTTGEPPEANTDPASLAQALLAMDDAEQTDFLRLKICKEASQIIYDHLQEIQTVDADLPGRMLSRIEERVKEIEGQDQSENQLRAEILNLTRQSREEMEGEDK